MCRTDLTEIIKKRTRYPACKKRFFNFTTNKNKKIRNKSNLHRINLNKQSIKNSKSAVKWRICHNNNKNLENQSNIYQHIVKLLEIYNMFSHMLQKRIQFIIWYKKNQPTIFPLNKLPIDCFILCNKLGIPKCYFQMMSQNCAKLCWLELWSNQIQSRQSIFLHTDKKSRTLLHKLVLWIMWTWPFLLDK